MFTRLRPWMLFGFGIFVGAAALHLLKETPEVQAQGRPNLAGLQMQITQLQAQVIALQTTVAAHTHGFSAITGQLAPTQIPNGLIGSNHMANDSASLAKVSGGALSASGNNLSVAGSVQVGPNDAAATAATVGTIRWNNNSLQVSDGTLWITYALENHTHDIANLTGTISNGQVANNFIASGKLASDSASLSKVSGGALSISSGNLTAAGKIAAAGTITVGSSSTAPSAPSAGAIYWNTTVNKLMVYDGTAWKTITSN